MHRVASPAASIFEVMQIRESRWRPDIEARVRDLLVELVPGTQLPPAPRP